MSVNAFRTERLLDPATSQLVREAYDPEYQQELYSVSPHVRESLREDNILVARADNQHSAAMHKLVEHLHSEAVRSFIQEKYQGAVVPAF